MLRMTIRILLVLTGLWLTRFGPLVRMGISTRRVPSATCPNPDEIAGAVHANHEPVLPHFEITRAGIEDELCDRLGW